MFTLEWPKETTVYSAHSSYTIENPLQKSMSMQKKAATFVLGGPAEANIHLFVHPLDVHPPLLLRLHGSLRISHGEINTTDWPTPKRMNEEEALPEQSVLDGLAQNPPAFPCYGLDDWDSGDALRRR
jgi:hypothetical protein